MKKRRWVIYCLLALALAALGEMPFQERDVGKLLPVETSLIWMEDGKIAIETDLGLKGYGDTLEKAVANLQERAPGVVFYDTGEYILLHDSALGLENTLAEQEFLRGSCALCRVDSRELDLQAAGAYLSANRPEMTLRQVAAAAALGQTAELPLLCWEEEEFILVSGEA